ncbi:Probable alpha,alpha-trehalose-phosphate synthase [UDP-forming] 11 [Dionaea muscipula]
MLSRSCLNLLNLEDLPAAGINRPITRIPRVITAPGIIDFSEDDDDEEEEEEGEDEGSNCNVHVGFAERRIVVANQLPVKVLPSEEGGKMKRWRFELDPDALLLQLKDGFEPGTEVIYVGCLKGGSDVTDPKEQEEVARHLFDKFRCLPVFLPPETQERFYHGFCKHYLWPLFHYKLPLPPVHYHHGVGYDPADWQAYVSANMIFADTITEVINPDEDFIWVHDYHLMVLPTILRRRFHRIKLGFFLHSPFPSSEIYRTVPVRDSILKGLLNSDLVGFHTFDYARHFLSCCRRMLGLDYRSRRGYIGLEYYGRTVNIKILPVGIHMGQLQDVLSLPETGKIASELRDKFEGKVVMVGVDDMDVLKGISFKFLAMGQLLEENPELRGKVVLVQITNPPRSWGQDVQEVQSETRRIAEDVNAKYGKPGYYEPIILKNGPVSTVEKAAYYAVSDCCVVNAVRDGMNLVPYKYTVCRQGGPVLDKVLLGKFDGGSKNSVIIVSEFIGCSPSLSGAIRVNPWNVDCVADAMLVAIRMPLEEKQLRHEKHYRYISSHDVAYWSRSFDQDLKRATADHHVKRCWGMGFGLGFRVVSLDPDFRKLSVDHLVSAYGKTKSRLILLDYDGTMTVPQTSVDNAPGEEAIAILNGLSSDPKNVVFIVSGRGRDTLSKWFSPCERLGISAEHGYFTRWSRNSTWESDMMATNLEWKKSAKAVMEHYTEATDGSYIEEKETAIVWHHQAADPDFGSCQAKELLDHLENVLANEPVVVKQGQHIVEVKPQGVSKGLVVKNVIEVMRKRGNAPDFLLCIGDDRSDEDMFESIALSVSDGSILPATAEVFACTVGQKPSMAKYYLDDSVDVINLLRGLAKASGNKPEQMPDLIEHHTFSGTGG